MDSLTPSLTHSHVPGSKHRQTDRQTWHPPCNPHKPSSSLSDMWLLGKQEEAEEVEVVLQALLHIFR